MNNQQKWTIAEDVLRNAFGELAIEEKYYPLFKERAIIVLNNIADSFEPEHEDYESSIEFSCNYIGNYVNQIKRGKSPIYAEQYSLCIAQGIGEEYCELYASKYEECINKGRDEKKAIRIAYEYIELYERYWPEDDNLLGIEAHKGYMEGFEYAIDNNIESPEKYAERFEEKYLAERFPDEMFDR